MAPSEVTAPLPPGARRNMVLVTSLLIAIMATLDMTIVAVALPYMAGNLGAGPDEITWVVTMFTVGQAIVIGITGHLTRLLGRKRLAIIVVIGFVATSILCALSQSLLEIVVFRFIQGVFSGPLIPLSQAVLIDAFSEKERPRALSLWTMGVLGGPALGPIIGGYLAQHLSWRWNFWINLPVGIIALFMILGFLRALPPQRVRTDYVGLVLLSLMIVGLQLTLDQGNELDWFSSWELIILATVAVTAAIAFFWRGISLGERNIVNLGLFRDLNFTACAILVAILGSVFLGLLVINPRMTVELLGWDVQTAGLVLGMGGMVGMSASLLSGHLSKFVSIRPLLISGALIMALGWVFYSRLAVGASPWEVMLPSCTIMFGVMLIFPQLASQAFSNLRPDQRDEGAGLFNLVKTMGFSLGVAGIDTFIYRGDQANWSRQISDFTSTAPPLTDVLQLGELPQMAALLAVQYQQQVSILTLTQLAQVLAGLAVVCVPLIFMLRRSR